MTKRIAIVTGGGDCPGLNAVIRAVTKAATLRGWHTIGIEEGYEGIFHKEKIHDLDYRALDGLLIRGGTILGTATHGRFASKVGYGETRQLPSELLEEFSQAFEALNLSALVCIGGDGTLTTAVQLFEHGVPVIGVPKTIDNDLAATVMTFGFDSAVACATDALDRLHTTGDSHDRVMILEVMGRYAGWIAVYAGLAGGADVILIPEIPFHYERVCEKVADREKKGKDFTIVITAEGARPEGEGFITAGKQQSDREAHLGGIGERIASEVQKRTGKEARVVVLGHLQRGGSPTHMDRALCTFFGTRAVELIADGKFGRMVSYTGRHVTNVPLAEATAELRTVPLDSGFIRAARALGVSFGN